MSYVSVIISGAASLGVLIGLLSGIFFLVLTALKWVSRVREALYDEELRRQKKILFSNANSVALDTENFLETRRAENGFGTTIREYHLEKKSECLESNSGNTVNWNEKQTEEKTSEKQDPNSETIRVREFIEKMVENLIGGPLDGTTVGQLSNHSACKRPLELDSSNFSQCNLKRVIKRIVSEAMTLPDIKEILCRPKTKKVAENDDFENKSYEDVLATAILNKVIEHFQNRENETTEYKPKPRPRSKKLNKIPDDDDQKSISDWSDVSRSDQLSLTIEEYIEEVTTALEASEDEKSDFSDFETNVNRRIPFPEAGRTVVDGTDVENSDEEEQSSATELFTSTSSWEENWLFQKKRLRSTPNAHHPVPVPMLVPKPSEDYKALVGGVDADDLSDMSDCSDLIMEDQNARKNTFNQLSKEKICCENITKEQDENEKRKDKDDVKEIIKENPHTSEKNNNLNFSPINLEKNENTNMTAAAQEENERIAEEIIEEEKSNSSPTSPTQKDREFSVEDFNLLQQCESSCRSESPTGTTLTSIESENSSLRSRAVEREREKWSNPVSLVDNPYSLENIERRAKRKNNDFFRIGAYTGESIDFPEDLPADELTKSSENLRFTRDYYINGSKHPSGKSPSSFSRLSKEYDQKSSTNEKSSSLQKTETFTMEEKNHEASDTQKIKKNEFCLPNVKELAKQFTLQDIKKTIKTENEQGKRSETKQKLRSVDGAPVKEPELDYSTIPVSEIVYNLQQTKDISIQPNKQVPCNIRPKTQIEICRKTSAEDKKFGTARFNGKEVHSLTARSISKEFREGLKNNNYQNVFLKINRAVRNGEHEQNDTVYQEEKTSPTQSIDLKNMRKFWEEIITANANATKQK